MNLENIKVPTEAELTEMETTAETVRKEMKAAAESATAGAQWAGSDGVPARGVLCGQAPARPRHRLADMGRTALVGG